MTLVQRTTLAVAGLLTMASIAFIFVKDRPARGGSSSPAGAASSAPAASGAPGAGERIVPVTTSVVARKAVAVIIEGLGTVTPLATVTLRSQVDGRLDRVFFHEGDAVKRGDLLAQIDPRPFEIQLHSAEATSARDSATLKNAQRDLERYEQLRKDNFIPQQQLDTQRALVAQLEGTTKTDQAQIETAHLNLDYAHIRSPVDGVTGVRLVDPGNLVRATDSTGIVIVTQLDPIAVLFTLPQDDLPRVQRAMRAGKLVVEAYARDGIERLGSGTLELVDNEVNAQTATIRLKAVMPNPDRALWPNAFVKARLHLETRSNALVVPAVAIQRGPKGTFVYLVGADKTANLRTIEVASTEGEEALIAKGLEAGEVVVTDGQNQLRPGAKVAPRSPPSAPPASSASASGARPAASSAELAPRAP
jgi:multidrug efflux system membrane fusion protein